ncbi:hypothetical protein FHE66_13100 [Georgenia sp. 311]|uniref:LPXTG cell wall anchor domain-containing protein n=1 Tax=Georgenia wutianyii TaxID=2585135 RepID=A0ABX5VQJ2_9MICO|nr:MULTISPECIES: hypothetical protein [Georgenia]QDB80323.1 hypothetical protein FE251_13745 [Georgenia wutianyii]TNC16976.1 hypothetical protein FHE66_13100 [Georgenia sp. 311]
MSKSIVHAFRAAALGVLILAVPLTATAQEAEPGGADVGVEVEITPRPAEPTTEPTVPATPPATDPTTAPGVAPTVRPTTPPPSGSLQETGFTGLQALVAAGVLVLAGGAVLVHRRRTA